MFTYKTEGGHEGEILYFPRTYAGGENYQMVITSPVIFDEKILYAGRDSFINFFTLRGVSVYLVRKKPSIGLRQYGQDFLKAALIELRKKSAQENWVLGGISMGGIGVLYYLMQEEKAGRLARRVDKVFFLGTGFDYNYPGSVAEKTAGANDRFCVENPVLCENLFGEKNLPLYPAEFVHLRKDQIVAARNEEALRDIVPGAIFIGGKIDNFAPSESIFPIYNLYGRKQAKGNVRFYQASEVNFYQKDFHHMDLFRYSEAFSKLYEELNYYLRF
ncbi:MAG: hypothetical protein NZM25_01565 [Leptospiraceae bacterium]|nr:hypothetical protein [Leptospiraceae bacterium]MDW8307633.1 hypothetical protein [Leptospiraceae bacterium]